MTLPQMLHSGYRKDHTGFYRKRVAFDIPNRPELEAVKYLTRNDSGNLVHHGRIKWVKKRVDGLAVV